MAAPTLSKAPGVFTHIIGFGADGPIESDSFDLPFLPGDEGCDEFVSLIDTRKVYFLTAHKEYTKALKTGCGMVHENNNLVALKTKKKHRGTPCYNERSRA